MSVRKVKELPNIEPPPRSAGPWMERLKEVVEDQGEWYIVHTADTNDKAGAAVSNLNRRKVMIPDPTGRWSFTQRKTDVYARYDGPVQQRRAGRRSRDKTAA